MENLVVVRASRNAGEDQSTAMTESVPPIVCNQPDDVAEVQALDGYRLRVRFHDGIEGYVNMNDLIHSPRAGVFAQLVDPARFAEAEVQYGTVTWPGEFDLAPDAMYAEIKQTGEWILR
ncbi:MAG: DUF2442 domain-containing protein [Acidobacteriaceae bacterium]|nr:DUF2442 domain-containing protein [Acidobacteriaceae bacterium]